MSNENIVKLNVGGTIFQTSKSTLTRFDGFFKTMLETNVPITKDESGAIFIDRNPAHFGKILDYMRDGKVVLPNAPEDVEEIQNEAQYYLLKGLVELCRSSGNSSGAPNKRVFAKSDAELAEMIVNSTKKVVCVFYYEPSEHNVLFRTTDALMKYGNKVDFYFKEFHFSIFYICDKQTNRMCQGTINEHLGHTIKNFIPNIDQY